MSRPDNHTTKYLKEARIPLYNVFITATSVSFGYTSTLHKQHKPQEVKMKLIISLILMVATTGLSVQACKCVNPDGGADNDGVTESCCFSIGGTFQDGNDCAAVSISNNLTGFLDCCKENGLNSDCST
jgi:hypothetical protein